MHKDYPQGEYSVKGLKTFRGMEGVGFNVTLYRGSKKVCFIMDEAQGGDYRYEWADYQSPDVEVETFGYDGKPRKVKVSPEEALLIKYVGSLPWEESSFEKGKKYPVSEDIFIENLVSRIEEEKMIARHCKKKTCFTLNDTKIGEFLTISTPFSKEMELRLKAKHGANLKEILNLRFIKE